MLELAYKGQVFKAGDSVRGMTRAEYDALPEEEKNGLIVITDEPCPSEGGGDGQPGADGKDGKDGVDGGPVGSIISFMGTVAPKDYLICDGATYDISVYPELAQHFNTQFGSMNYFGGDGTTTFAVPDLRNQFIRGYHGSATTISGDIGKLQYPTEVPTTHQREPVMSDQYACLLIHSGEFPANHDGYVYQDDKRALYLTRYQDFSLEDPVYDEYAGYAVRPMNVAVLFCIKARDAKNAENVYSTEEQVVGTWIDGKPIYKKTTIIGSASLSLSTRVVVSFPGSENIDTLIKREVNAASNNQQFIDEFFVLINQKKQILVYMDSGSATFAPFILTLYYTKTTD